MMKKIIISALVASTLLMAGGSIVPEEEEVASVLTEENRDWQQRVIVYGWLPTVDGTLNYDIGGSNAVSIEVDELIDSLEMTFMAAYEARKNKWSFKADVIYLNLANTLENAVTGPRGNKLKAVADLSMTAWMSGFYGGYNVHESSNLIFDLLAGARYLSVDVGTTLLINGPLPVGLPSPELAQKEELWDAVVGFKGLYSINENWFLPFHFDIGAGDSDLTWQALAAVGYHYSWGDLLLAYRHTSYDQGGNGLVQDLVLSGPAIGINFNF
jgi:hypothetical protein